MKFISLFSGIGGFDKGFEDAGLTCVAQVEKDKDCIKVLKSHWPNIQRFEDVRDAGMHNLPIADVLCGGFPCQPHSTAGRRLASRDERDMWGEFARIIGETKPGWVVAENVPGLLTSESGRFFGRILRDLAQCGYDAEWDSIPASIFGAPHERERVIIVAYPISKRLQGRFFEKSLCSIEDAASTQFGNENITCGGWWTENSANIRMGDGVPLRLARRAIHQYGNAIVPQVAEWLGQRILEVEASV